MSANKGPLAGIRVLDLGRHLSCPSCGMTLGDLGAEVIKVEKSGYGDETRHEGEKIKGHSLYYLTENRNKKGITIDFRSEEGKELLRDDRHGVSVSGGALLGLMAEGGMARACG